MTSFAGSFTAKAAWNRMKSVPMKYPFMFGVLFSGMKTSFSDFVVQKVVERREKVDWRRNSAFAAFGFLYLGGIQYAIYVPFFGRLFPGAAAFAAKSIRDKLKDTKGLFGLAAQVLIDQCIHHPLMYFPAFYCTKELVLSDKPDLPRALRDYRKNMKEDLLALWKIWVPGTILNFAFMPMYARIPFVAGISLLWTMILSSMRGGDALHGDDMAGGAVTGATLTLLNESIETRFTTPVELDRDRSHLVLTASGHDKPGWVAQISRSVAEQGGNITHSKMVRLGNDFIVQMHVAIPPESRSNLIKSLDTNKELKPFNVECRTISRRNTGTYEAPVMGFHLRCVGQDKPGMLASITETLTETGLSIDNITTHVQRHNRIDPTLYFVVEADCVATRYIPPDDLDNLVSKLSHIKQDLNLDTIDVRVQRLKEAPTHE